MADAPAVTSRTATALAVTGLGPAVAALFYFVLLPGTTGPRVVYLGSKLALGLFPILWTRWVERRPLTFPRPRRSGLAAGIVFALLAAAAGWGLYLLCFRGEIDVAPIRAQAVRLGFLDHYWTLALALSLVNSAYEEYYWRWFVFGQCRRWLSTVPAAIAAGVCFSLHHLIVLQSYFPLGLALLLSAGIAAGGTVWAWIYARGGSLYAPWVSHILVDLAVFGIGYDLLF